MSCTMYTALEAVNSSKLLGNVCIIIWATTQNKSSLLIEKWFHFKSNRQYDNTENTG